MKPSTAESEWLLMRVLTCGVGGAVLLCTDLVARFFVDEVVVIRGPPFCNASALDVAVPVKS